MVLVEIVDVLLSPGASTTKGLAMAREDKRDGNQEKGEKG